MKVWDTNQNRAQQSLQFLQRPQKAHLNEATVKHFLIDVSVACEWMKDKVEH